MGGLSDPKTNRKLLLTSYLLWPRYLTYRSRRWLRLRLQKYQLVNQPFETVSASAYKLPVISDPNSELESKGYLFVENFMDQDSYNRLIEAWPKKRWFEPLKFGQNGKSYDSGLRWNVSKQRADKTIEANPEVLSIYSTLRSTEFCDNLTEICNDQIERESYSLLLTQSYSHSYLTPHQDSMGKDTKKNSSIVNIIYFVQANGNGWESGGTSILGDATFSKPIFVPQNLNNTALIYRGAANLWHGFPRIARGNYRKTILSAYWMKSDSM